jgi:hypothetical protein
VAKNVLRPKNREKQKQNRGRAATAEPKKKYGPADSPGDLFHQSLRGELHLKKKEVVKRTSSKASPSRSGDSLSGCGGRAAQSKSAEWEANAPQGLAFVFLLASGRRRPQTGKQPAHFFSQNV